MDAPAPAQRSGRPRARSLWRAMWTPAVALCAGTAALAALVLGATVVIGTPWPATLLVVAAAAPAAVPVCRSAHVVTVLLVAAAVAGTLLLSEGARTAAPWLVAAALGAAALGVWGSRRHGGLVGALAESDARRDATSLYDDLTGCSNHAGLLLFGDHMLQGVRRRGEAMHALVLSVDGLAQVHERLGRGAESEVLVAVADALRSSTRGTDVVARVARDGFGVLGPGAGVSPGELERRIRAHTVETPPAPLDVWPRRVTVGLAVLEPWDSGDVVDLLRKANEDLSLRAALRAPSAPEPVHRREPGTR